MTPEQMHGVADLLRSLPLWPIVVVVLASMFRHPIEKAIKRVVEIRAPGGWWVKLATEQVKEALATPAPADADPQIEAAKAPRELAQVLVGVDGKTVPIEELVGRVAIALHLSPHTPTGVMAASDLLTAYSNTVTTTGFINLKGDQVTIKLKPEAKPTLEQKAKKEQ